MTRTHVRIVVKAGRLSHVGLAFTLTDGRYWRHGSPLLAPRRAHLRLPVRHPRRRAGGRQGTAHLQAAHRPSRRAAPPLQVRPDPHHAGPEHDRHRAEQPQAERAGLHHDASCPNLKRTGRHACRASTSSTCTTASGSSTATRRGPRARRRPGSTRRKGFGWSYKPSDQWLMNYMIHNLTPNPDTVYITYDIDFIPATAPRRRASRRSTRSGWTSRASRPTRSSTPCGPTATSAGCTPTPTWRPTDPYKGGRKRNEWTVAERPDAGRRRPGTCIRAARRPS